MLYVLFIIFCCWVTYLYTLNKVIKLAKTFDDTDKLIIDYLGKFFEQIAIVKTSINNILEINCVKNDKEKNNCDTITK